MSANREMETKSSATETANTWGRKIGLVMERSQIGNKVMYERYIRFWTKKPVLVFVEFYM